MGHEAAKNIMSSCHGAAQVMDKVMHGWNGRFMGMVFWVSNSKVSVMDLTVSEKYEFPLGHPGPTEEQVLLKL